MKKKNIKPKTYTHRRTSRNIGILPLLVGNLFGGFGSVYAMWSLITESPANGKYLF